MEFKVGDRVSYLNSSDEIIEDINKKGEIRGRYSSGDVSRVYIDPKHYTLRKEAPMNLKERIEALTGWDKEADDILQEIGERLVIIIPCEDYCLEPERTQSVDIIESVYSGVRAHVAIEMKVKRLIGFPFASQCEKLQAFKNALLWLAEKAGKLDDKKDKLRKELVELKERVEALEVELR